MRKRYPKFASGGYVNPGSGARLWIGADNGQWFDLSNAFTNIQFTTKEEEVTRFKVGDRVRALDDVQIPKGTIGTVTDVEYPGSGATLYGIDGRSALTRGNWGNHFELVTDDIKVGDYVSIDKLYPKTGTVKSIQTYATVKSDSGQDYVRQLDELTPAVKPDPIPAEPAHNTAFKFSTSQLTWVWDVTGWSYLGYDGKKSGNRESWAKLWSRYIDPKSTRTYTVL